MGSSKRFTRVELEANLPFGLGNLLAIVAMATSFELINGPLWYKQGFIEASKLSERYGIALDRVIRCIACLSPQLRWSQNVLLAEIVIRYFVSGGYIPSRELYTSKQFTLKQLGQLPEFTLRNIPCNTTSASVIKALWILQGHDDALSGEKVESFFDNLMSFADSTRVTVDGHAVLAWLGINEAISATFDYAFYDVIKADYERLAEIMHVAPLDAQAIVWIVRRRIVGSDKKDHTAIDKLMAYLASM